MEKYLIALVIMSLITFIFYGIDKKRAPEIARGYLKGYLLASIGLLLKSPHIASIQAMISS